MFLSSLPPSCDLPAVLPAASLAAQEAVLTLLRLHAPDVHREVLERYLELLTLPGKAGLTSWRDEETFVGAEERNWLLDLAHPDGDDDDLQDAHKRGFCQGAEEGGDHDEVALLNLIDHEEEDDAEDVFLARILSLLAQEAPSLRWCADAAWLAGADVLARARPHEAAACLRWLGSMGDAGVWPGRDKVTAGEGEDDPTNISVHLVMGCPNATAGVRILREKKPYSNPNSNPITNYH